MNKSGERVEACTAAVSSACCDHESALCSVIGCLAFVWPSRALAHGNPLETVDVDMPIEARRFCFCVRHGWSSLSGSQRCNSFRDGLQGSSIVSHQRRVLTKCGA